VAEAKAPGAADKHDAKRSGGLFYAAIAASLLAGMAAWWALGRRT
jgi:hypothetical protein